MKKTKINLLIATTFIGVSLHAGQPKLVVGIAVDGLRQETLDMLRPHLEKDGFNRFFNQGLILENIDYGTNLDAVSASALLLTGASPNVNGIGCENVYDAEARRVNKVFYDSATLGNFSEYGFSPRALRVSTINDEIRIAGAGVTYVYSIAPTAAKAVVLAGHAGNSAVWFNENTGKWATSTFFSEMPYPALTSNRTNNIINKLDTLQWVPSQATKATSLPQHLVAYPFRYTFAGKGSDRFKYFAASPFINNEITILAQEYVKTLELGKHDGPDVLNLSYSLNPYEFSKSSENRYELYDSYIKLDKNLSELFRTIDQNIGKENVILYLYGTPQVTHRRKDDEKWRIPSGEFSSRKAVSLLNLYLIALHGNGEWVKAFHDGNFYLNKELANSLGKDVNQIREQASDCLIRMAGVGHAYTIDDILNASANVPNAQGRLRNTVITQTGDVVIELIPGWSLVDDFNNPGDNASTVHTQSPTTASFMISFPGAVSRRINATIDARAIAPTLAGLMHIRSPNGASIAPITLIEP